MKSKLSTAGERLKYIRTDLLKLSKSVIKIKYALKPDALYNWECGRVKITKSVFKKLSKTIFEPESLLVDEDWLINGNGAQPVKLSSFPLIKTNIVVGEIPEGVLIQKELSFFMNFHPDAICMQVDSECMSPFYQKGDYVCGKLVSDDNIGNLLGNDCIIILKNGSKLVRRIVSINPDNTFNIVGHNLSVGMIDATHLNVDIKSAAKILLHRKIKKHPN